MNLSERTTSLAFGLILFEIKVMPNYPGKYKTPTVPLSPVHITIQFQSKQVINVIHS